MAGASGCAKHLAAGTAKSIAPPVMSGARQGPATAVHAVAAWYDAALLC